MALEQQILDILKQLLDEYVPYENYFTSEDTVVTGDRNAKTFDIEKALSRIGRYGYIISDSGTILVSVNGEENITLKNGETLSFRGLKVKGIKITTASAAALNYRLVIF